MKQTQQGENFSEPRLYTSFNKALQKYKYNKKLQTYVVIKAIESSGSINN